MRHARLQRFIAALRREQSGQRGPASGMRDGNDQLDPFGVLCNLYRHFFNAPGDPDWIQRDDGWAFGWSRAESEAYYPPEPVLDWLGMSHMEAVELGELFDTGESEFGGGMTLREVAAHLSKEHLGKTPRGVRTA